MRISALVIGPRMNDMFHRGEPAPRLPPNAHHAQRTIAAQVAAT
jgi:hypothetical protein